MKARIKAALIILPALFQLSACQQEPGLSCLLTDWMTPHYQAEYEKIADLPESDRKPKTTKSKRPQAQRYHVDAMHDSVNSCSALLVQKELKLALPEVKKLRLVEINDYYTAKGKHIARFKQDISHQLTSSGYYLASDSLPVPADAAKGKYRIRSTLTLEKPGHKKAIRLARSQTYFSIK